MISTLLLPVLLLATPPTATAHIDHAAIDRIIAPAEEISTPTTKRIPAGLPLSAALFAGKPWWAVLQMCSEHRTGAGWPPGTPAPELTAAAEKNRLFFMHQAATLFGAERGLTPTDALMPVSGWGSEFIVTMNTAAKQGSWSSTEFEDACRILGAQHLRGG